MLSAWSRGKDQDKTSILKKHSYLQIVRHIKRDTLKEINKCNTITRILTALNNNTQMSILFINTCPTNQTHHWGTATVRLLFHHTTCCKIITTHPTSPSPFILTIFHKQSTMVRNGIFLWDQKSYNIKHEFMLEWSY